MGRYYLDATQQRFHPDRRHGSTLPPREQRKHHAQMVTSEQFTHLRDSLNDRQRVKAILGKRERTARHLLYGMTAAFIAYIFATPGFSLYVQGISITDKQLAALFPLLTAYLVVYACHTGATHLRVRYECKLLDHELQRFGSITVASVNHRMHKLCSPTNPSVWVFFSTTAFNLVYGLHDILLVVSVALALGGSGAIAVRTYSDLKNVHPVIANIFIGYLVLAGIVSVGTPLCLRYARLTRSKAMDEYLETFRPSGAMRDDVAKGGA